MLSCHLGDSPSAALYEKFGAIPISVWDDELPTLEACARETQRILGAGIALRRNLREDTKIGGRVVKRGDFLVYSFGEAHVNPEYYPEPHKYDPGRWLRPDPVPNAPYPFLGWGAGRHPCTGMKVAKLEIKLALAMFLTRYEFDLVDEDGKFPDPLPAPDKNGFNGVRVESRTGILCINAHGVFPVPLCIDPSSWYILLQLQEGRGLDRWLRLRLRPSQAFEPPREHIRSDTSRVP